jgi:hypothetical protein
MLTNKNSIKNKTSNPLKFNLLFCLLVNLAIVSISLIPNIRGIDLIKSISESDQGTYISNAYHLIETGHFTREDAPPYLWEPYRTPGYPLLIALSLSIFGSIVPTLFFNIAFAIIAVYFGTKLLQNYTSDKHILMGYGILFTCLPNLSGLNCFLLTDSVAASLAIIWAYYLVKVVDFRQWKSIIPLTILIIMAQMVKPTFNSSFILVLFVYCFTYWKRWRLINYKQMACVIIGCLVTPIFLSFKIHSDHNTFSPTLLSEATIREYLVPSYLSGKTGEDYNTLQKEYRQKDIEEARTLEGNGISYYGNLHHIKKQKNDSIVSLYKTGLAVQIVKESVKQLFAPQEYLFIVFSPTPPTMLRLAGAGINLIYLLLIALGLYYAFTHNIRTPVFTVIMLYFLCVSAGALSARQGGRLKLPADAVALTIAAIGLGYIKGRWTKTDLIQAHAEQP